jgi:hypothetical protein
MKTIKLLIAAVLLTFGISSASAQSLPDVDFGLKAGINFSTVNTELNAITDKSGKIGLNAGVFTRFGKELYFQPEVNYVTFSDKYRFNDQPYEPKFRDINVPLMIGYKIINTPDLNFRVSIGPDLYYNLKDPIAPAGFKYKDFSTGGVLNAGVDIRHFVLDARYSLGLSKYNADRGQKSNIFSLGAGFKF